MAADFSYSAEQTPEELVDILTGGKVDAMTKTTHTWGDSDTKALILLYAEFAEKFKNPFFKKKKIWETVAARMLELSFPVTALQCEGLWKYLTKTYRKIEDHNYQTGRQIHIRLSSVDVCRIVASIGRDRKEWRHTRQMAEIYSHI